MSENSSVSPAKPARLASLDALRGFDMFWITGGAGMACAVERLWFPGAGVVRRQLEHAEWVGMRFEDLIMPLFMFLAGVSLPFATASRLAKDPSKARLWGHVLKRVALLWVFGMVVQGDLLSWDPARWIWYSNTLQAIAAGFLVAFVFHLHAPVRVRYAGAVALLLLTWAVYAGVPAPGGIAGDYAQGANVAQWLDGVVLGERRGDPSYAWVLGTLNFGVTTMIGLFAGYWLRREDLPGTRRTLGLVAAGVALVAAALCWAPFHPIIKRLWTGSFTLLSGGLSLLLLALFHWVIDVRGWRRWSHFFTVIGVNAITAYLLAELVPFRRLSERFFGGFARWLPGPVMELVLATGAVALLWLVLRLLYKNRIFLKV